jgi:formylglycine-generating enzyme required for sulfatase activity
LANRSLKVRPTTIAFTAAFLALASACTEAAEPKVFRDCAGCPELVTIPASSFIMGTSASTKNARMRRALRAHKVVLAKPFAIGRFEVTFDEWEHAARAGAQTRFSWGNDAGKNNANCRTCAPKISKRTHEVGKYKPHPFGLYDVHGNVWEWVQDCWNTSYKDAPADGSVWLKGTCHFRVTRGGLWYYIDANLQSAWRSKYPNAANGFSYGIGFRVVRELP